MSTAPPLADEAAAERMHHHSWLEDVQAVVTGTLFVALGIALFRHAGLVTGGTAGIAFVLHYAMGWPFGAAFFVLNLPFYVLAWRRMGRAFTLKTLGAVALMSLLSEALPRMVTVQAVDAAFAAAARARWLRGPGRDQLPRGPRRPRRVFNLEDQLAAGRGAVHGRKPPRPGLPIAR